MELSSEAQALSQCWQQCIQAQVPRAPWGDVDGSTPAEPPTYVPPPPQTPHSCPVLTQDGEACGLVQCQHGSW